MINQDIHYMSLAIELAKKGQGKTSPNPCVGAVIVKNGEIVGRGYHKKAGTPHAEVNAIADAGDLATGATIYVTLEPCNHTGRTPPCTQAILNAGIRKVVVGMADPNPSVEGNGSSFLQSMGLQVETGILEEECLKLNRPFIKHSTTGLPWIVMKAGMSLDGKISYRKGYGGRITGSKAGTFTHSLRNSLDAILVGVGTTIIDNPSLTSRLPGDERGRDPVRVILDTHLRLPSDLKILRQESTAPTWIFCGPDAANESERRLAGQGAVIHRVGLNEKKQLDLREVLLHIGKLNINSVLVEGGAAIHGSMLHHQLVDEVFLFIAPFFIGQSGTPLLEGFSFDEHAKNHCLRNVSTQQLGDDMLIHGFL